MLALAALPGIIAALAIFAPSVIEPFWPLPNTSDQAFIFVGSILAAAAASTLWAAWEGEDVSFGGIGLDIAVIFWPLAIWLLVLDPANGGGLSALALGALGTGLFGTWLAWRTVRAPMTDPRPTPRMVLVAFVAFVGVLLVAAVTLIGGRPNTLPWPATREVAMMTGLIFLGAASYFVFGLARRGWSNAGGQLAGFLAYDLVLIPPLVMRSGTIPGYWRDSLWLYLAVLIGSGALAAWYLFLDPRTRLGSRSAERGPTSLT
jgi:hypothetical protein